MKTRVWLLLWLVFATLGGPSRFTPAVAATLPAQPAEQQVAPALAPSVVQAPTAPLTTHPRLWLTQADLPRLRAWAVATNPMYQNGLGVAATTALTRANANWNWGTGQPTAGWQDTGGSYWEQDATEAYAQFFAFMSLVHPDAQTRSDYALRSRAMLMYVMNQAALGAASAPFRRLSFSTSDRSRWWGEGFGLTVDWLQYHPGLLTAQDKATIRTVFLRWANENLNAATANNEHPQPIGVTNDPALLSDLEQLRWSANNYYLCHFRNLALMALSLDEADDPPLNPNNPPTQLGNTLRSYIGNATGAWLYQIYATFEDPAIAASALGVAPTGLGLASGGLPAEGFLYGPSVGRMHQALFALQTAGYHSPTLAGPQINLLTSTYWEQWVNGFLHSVTPAAHVPTDPAYSNLGPIYEMANYGDLQNFYIAEDAFVSVATLGVQDYNQGNTTRWNKIRWIALNVMPGGAADVYERAGSVWGNSNASHAILYFMLFDPQAAPPTDPRPTLALNYYAAGLNRILARTAWTTATTWFAYKCHWITINHQGGDCNQFDFYRQGEWLTKERSGYGDDSVAPSSDFHNTLTLQNSTTSGNPPDLSWFEGPLWERGSQWTNGGAGTALPTVTVSLNPNFVYALGDATPLYNHPDQWSADADFRDIVHASRSIFWLKPDHVVIYDRATSLTANRFKRFNLTLITTPTLTSHLATVTTPNGQRFYIQNLLPVAATMSITPAENFNQVANLEPTRVRLTVQDPSNPQNVRFLHVLQGADPGTAQTPLALIQNTSGMAFEGAVVSTTAVLFPVNLNQPFTVLTYTVMADTTTHYVTGLAPLSGYDVTTQGPTIALRPGTTYYADSGGVLAFGTNVVTINHRLLLPFVRR